MLIRHLVIDLKNDQTFTTFANKRRAYLAPRYACSIKCPQVNNAYVGNLITANNNIHHTGSISTNIGFCWKFVLVRDQQICVKVIDA